MGNLFDCNPCNNNNCSFLEYEAKEHARQAEALRVEYEVLEAKGFEAQAEGDKYSKIADKGFKKSEYLFRKSAELYSEAEQLATESKKYADMAIECYKHNCECYRRKCEELENISKCKFQKSLVLVQESKRLRELAVTTATEAHELAVTGHTFAVKSIEYFGQAEEVQKQAEAKTLEAAELYRKTIDCYKGIVY